MCSSDLGVGGPPQVPVRPMAYTPCFQGDPRSTLDKMADGRGAELTEMTTFHPESPRILGSGGRRGVVVCSVAPNMPPVSPCRSDCDSLRKSPWDDEGERDAVCDLLILTHCVCVCLINHLVFQDVQCCQQHIHIHITQNHLLVNKFFLLISQAGWLHMFRCGCVFAAKQPFLPKSKLGVCILCYNKDSRY